MKSKPVAIRHSDLPLAKACVVLAFGHRIMRMPALACFSTDAQTFQPYADFKLFQGLLAEVKIVLASQAYSLGDGGQHSSWPQSSHKPSLVILEHGAHQTVEHSIFSEATTCCIYGCPAKICPASHCASDNSFLSSCLH